MHARRRRAFEFSAAAAPVRRLRSARASAAQALWLGLQLCLILLDSCKARELARGHDVFPAPAHLNGVALRVNQRSDKTVEHLQCRVDVACTTDDRGTNTPRRVFV